MLKEEDPLYVQQLHRFKNLLIGNDKVRRWSPSAALLLSIFTLATLCSYRDKAQGCRKIEGSGLERH
jgi:hypothetical protein